MHELLEHLLSSITPIVITALELIGVLIIILGVIAALVNFVGTQI